MSHPLDSIVFITIPETHHISGNFPSFDPSIPLPVQLSAPEEKFEVSSLTKEMILAGMLAVFAYDPENAQLEYYRTIMKAVYPSIREEMTDAAIMKIRNGDFALAEEIFLALRGLDPKDGKTILNLALLNDERADSMRKAGLEDEADALDSAAFSYYKAAMTAEQPIHDAFFNAGFFYLKQKNYKKARETLETYLTVETGSTETIRTRRERAKALVDEISSRDLDDDLFKSAYDFITMGEEERGLEHIRLFLEHHPKVWNAWFLLGWALRRLERWEDAKAAFLQALELGKAPNSGIETGYVDICNELAICLMELEDFSSARSFLTSALEMEGENTKIMSNFGMLALKQGNRKEAAQFFKTVLEFDPKDTLAREMLTGLSEED